MPATWLASSASSAACMLVLVERLPKHRQRFHATLGQGLVQTAQVHGHALGHGGDELACVAFAEPARTKAQALVVARLDAIAQFQQFQQQRLLCLLRRSLLLYPALLLFLGKAGMAVAQRIE